jgi:cytochrome c oxidase subunit II
VADENYIRESILFPAAKIVSGFNNIMPSWQGQVSEDQLDELIAYIRSLNPAPRGAASTAGAAGGNPPQSQ